MLSLQLLHPALSVSSGTLIGLTGETLCCFYANYSWSDCFVSEDASVSADKVGAVIVDGMSRFIPSSTKSFSPQNPWFDRACSRVIQSGIVVGIFFDEQSRLSPNEGVLSS